MATTVTLRPMSTTETNRIYVFDFTGDLLTSGSITSASAAHTPPSGAAATPVVVVDSPLVYVTLPAVTVTGRHVLECRATVDNTGTLATEVLSIRGDLKVEY